MVMLYVFFYEVLAIEDVNVVRGADDDEVM